MKKLDAAKIIMDRLKTEAATNNKRLTKSTVVDALMNEASFSIPGAELYYYYHK